VLSRVPSPWFTAADFDPFKQVEFSVTGQDADNFANARIPSSEQLFHEAGWVDPNVQVQARDIQSSSHQFDLSSAGEHPSRRHEIMLADQNVSFCSARPHELALALAELVPDEDNYVHQDVDAASHKELAQKILQTFGESASAEFEILRLNPEVMDLDTSTVINSVGNDVVESMEDQSNDQVFEVESDDGEAPKSMAEIVRMSNKNKKRNKEKKRLKTSCQSDPNAPFVLPLSDEKDADMESSHRDIITGDSVKFMKAIGWVNEGDNLELDEDGIMSGSPQTISPSTNAELLGGSDSPVDPRVRNNNNPRNWNNNRRSNNSSTVGTGPNSGANRTGVVSQQPQPRPGRPVNSGGSRAQFDFASAGSRMLNPSQPSNSTQNPANIFQPYAHQSSRGRGPNPRRK
jgi:hypothetical protein